MSKIGELIDYFAEARVELGKVTWPTKQQTISVTWVVILLSFLLAIFLGLADLGLSKLVKLVLK